MKFPFLFLVVAYGVQAGRNVEVEGEISLKLNIPSNAEHKKYRVQDQQSDIAIEVSFGNPRISKSYKERVENQGTGLKVEENDTKPASGEDYVMRGHEHDNVTVGPMVECTYQMPEEAQVQALLSNMMNELTKVFVRAHDMIYNSKTRRRGGTRFTVVSQKQSEFFDTIYSNMTQQYLEFYNTTTVRVDRSEGQKDPCKNQEEMKGLWKELLDSSLMTFRHAAFECINEDLKAKKEAEDSKLREKMGQYLLRELSKIKMRQLELLCDKFQLCYDELNTRFYKRRFR